MLARPEWAINRAMGVGHQLGDGSGPIYCVMGVGILNVRWECSFHTVRRGVHLCEGALHERERWGVPRALHVLWDSCQKCGSGPTAVARPAAIMPACRSPRGWLSIGAGGGSVGSRTVGCPVSVSPRL